jgi:hypothetical protein
MFLGIFSQSSKLGVVNKLTSQGLAPGKFLFSLEKESKDRHEGDLSRSRFVNAKQGKSAL